MAFGVIHTNSVVEVRHRPRPRHTARDAVVVCVFGNTAHWASIWNDWAETPAEHADVCISVRTSDLEQAVYVQGTLDGPHTHHDDLTGSDVCHTDLVLDGVLPALLQVAQETRWVIHGASGGCVTAVSLARLLYGLGHEVLGVVADCGVPGAGDPLPQSIPCSIFRSTFDRFWVADGHEMIYEIWKASGYNVDFEGYGHDRHAWVVNAARLEYVLRYIEGAHGLRILQ